MVLSQAYKKIYGLVNSEIACIVFLKKKNNEVRCILSTRNTIMASPFVGYLGNKLNMFDGKYTNSQEIVPVIDLTIGDVRTVNVDRVIYTQSLPTPTTQEEFNSLVESFNRFEQSCLALLGKQTLNTLDMLDNDYLQRQYTTALNGVHMVLPQTQAAEVITPNTIVKLLQEKLGALSHLSLDDI